jgi:hypothetical protein
MRAPRLLVAGLLAGAAGCDASASAPAFDAGALIASAFACAVPASAPSRGSCIDVPDAGIATNDGGVYCNPVTNEPCASGQTCDTTADSSGNINGLACYSGENTATLCSACSVTQGPLCAGGLACADVGSALTACARFCCTDADCGSGRCAHTDADGNVLFAGLPSGLGECAAK